MAQAKNIRGGLLAKILTAVLLVWAAGLHAQGEVHIQPLAGSVYLITGPGGNVAASIGEDGILLVDDKFEKVAPEIRRAVASIKSGPIRFILNTHWHHDHTEGNKVFGKESIIVAHENVRKRLMSPTRTDFGARPALPPHAWPIITFDESVNIYFNGEKIEIRHFDHAHTDGDAVIYFTKSNVVHLGDIFFNPMFPFVDLNNGGNAAHLAEVVDQIVATIPQGARIIPGHGPVATRQDLIRYRDMLKATTQLVKKAVEEGQSLEQIQQSDLLKDFASWGEGFISTRTWIELLYRSLTKQ